MLTLPVALMLLAGCVPGPGASAATPSASATQTPTPTPTPTPTLTPTPTPVVVTGPLDTPCSGPSTTMSVWAHYDDDLLFLGSRIGDAIRAGGCVRTVFLTGGDAGRGMDYANGRERGIMRAYDVMRGAATPWAATDITLATGAPVVVWQPADDPRISLVFLHLPDGNLNGQGFPTTGEVSLAKLASDKILTLPNLYGSAQLSWSQIVSSIAELMTDFHPTATYTHVPGGAQKWAKGDHADHAITGVIGRAAWQQAGLPAESVSYVIGYQSAGYPVNVTGEELSRKIAAFRSYAADDSVVVGCTDDATCLAMPRFGQWLQRQYMRSEAELWVG